jgi:hypothetical protein
MKYILRMPMPIHLPLLIPLPLSLRLHLPLPLPLPLSLHLSYLLVYIGPCYALTNNTPCVRPHVPPYLPPIYDPIYHPISQRMPSENGFIENNIIQLTNLATLDSYVRRRSMR